jgi:excisionase family DNA binding protein
MINHEDASYRHPLTPSLLRVRDVAERLSVSEPTVRRLVSSGELRRVRLGGSVRFRPQDVEALIERGHNRPVHLERTVP